MFVKQVNDAKLRVGESSRQHAIDTDLAVWPAQYTSPTPKLTSPTTSLGNNNKFGSAGQYTDPPQGVCVRAKAIQWKKKSTNFWLRTKLTGTDQFFFFGKHQKNGSKWKMFRPPSSFRQTTAIIDYRTSQTTVRALHNPNYHAHKTFHKQKPNKKETKKYDWLGWTVSRKLLKLSPWTWDKRKFRCWALFSVTQLSN